MWILSRIIEAWLSFSWKVEFTYFPMVKPLHWSNWESVPIVSPIDICCMIFKAPWWRWPNHLCHNSPSSQLTTFYSFPIMAAYPSTVRKTGPQSNKIKQMQKQRHKRHTIQERHRFTWFTQCGLRPPEKLRGHSFIIIQQMKGYNLQQNPL